ncbi:SET domain-containing protein [Athelia psychrophila]|uniref:SET domain-containing protein n=1 Tax=Athelia psychrophila TaxID=1759441 RepID=A0A166T0H2_9AGAM|nr:SET domain-containing protein [Fibularhizoctonia sp. CBS 109695]
MGDHRAPVDDYITFERVSEAAHRLPAPYLLAKDLPHTLQDQMNRLPAMYRKTQEAVSIFEASIREISAIDDPGAPPISIINPIEDDDEATPPWEFSYTNSIWHGEDVPAPDLKSLKGCNCHGVCNPKSKSCACVKKQSEWYEDENRQPGFAYHTSKSMQGRLQQPGRQYPIFECNDFCGCDDACGNRVVQHGRKCEVNIVKTKQKGWGVFAGPKRIPAGSFIGKYTGELLGDPVSEERGRKYNVFGRTYLFDVDGYQIGKTLGMAEGEYDAAYTIDAYHAGNAIPQNHSCEPNCMILCCYINEGDIERPLLTIFSMVDIEPNEELSFSYSGAPDDTEVEAAVRITSAVYAKCCCGAPSCKGIMFK